MENLMWHTTTIAAVVCMALFLYHGIKAFYILDEIYNQGGTFFEALAEPVINAANYIKGIIDNTIKGV